MSNYKNKLKFSVALAAGPPLLGLSVDDLSLADQRHGAVVAAVTRNANDV